MVTKNKETKWRPQYPSIEAWERKVGRVVPTFSKFPATNSTKLFPYF